MRAALIKNLALASGFALLAGFTAQAQTVITWNGTGGANWTTGTNWVGNAAPANDTATNTAQFTSATSGTVNVDSARSVAGLDIQRDTTFTGNTLTINATAGNTIGLTLGAGVTATFNQGLASLGGNRTLGNGSVLNFNAAAPGGGIFNMTNATVNYNAGSTFTNNNFNVSYDGTGMVNVASTSVPITDGFRFRMAGQVGLTIKSGMGNITSSNANGAAISFRGTTQTFVLERSYDFTPITSVTTANVNSNRGTLEFFGLNGQVLTVSGAYQASFNQLNILGTQANHTLTLNGSTLLIGSGSGNVTKGMFSVGGGGSAGDVIFNNATFTINSTANGGTVRLAAGTTSSFNADTAASNNYGETLIVGGSATFVNNGALTNKNYSTTATLAGLTVQSGGTLAGTGSFDMTSGNGTNAKTTSIAGTVAPGDGGIGTLTINGGAVTITGTGTAKLELGTAGASHASPGTSDRLAVSGALALGGTLNLIDNAGANGNGSAGAGSYQIFTQSGTATGSFSSITNITGYHAKVDTSTSGSVFVDNYQIASANTITSPVDLGKARVGGSFGTSALNIQNTAASNGYAEGLNATKGAVTGGASVSGTNISNLAGGSSSTTILLGLGNANMTTSGAKTGTVTIDLASNGTNSGYANTALASQVITVDGMVYDYAAPVFSQTGGNGTFGGSGQSFTLDFGTGLALNTTYTANIRLTNSQISLFQDALGGTYSFTGASQIGNTAATFNNLASGGFNAFAITFNTGSSGTFSGNLTLAAISQQSGLSDASLGNYNIAITGSAVPEPAAWILAAFGLTTAVVFRRRRV